MSSKHTPGPWCMIGSVRPVGDPDTAIGQSNEFCGEVTPGGTGKYRGPICNLQSCAHIAGITAIEARANARLIAAAPDLLEAAKAAEESLAQFRSEKSVDLSRLRAAIAKAEGQS